jgi:hypothetical protein
MEVNMNKIDYLTQICMLFELWHIVYRSFLYDKFFKKTEDIVKWADSQHKFNKYFVEFLTYFTNNMELRKKLGEDFGLSLVVISQTLRKLPGPTEQSRKLLGIVPGPTAFLYLLIQGAELAYLVILIMLASLIPQPYNIIMLVAFIAITLAQKHLNKKRESIWYNLDALLCIVIFAIIQNKF